MPDTMLDRFEDTGLLAQPDETYYPPGGSFYLLPLMPGQEQRTRGGYPAVRVHRTFDAAKRRRTSTRRKGVEDMVLRATGRTLFLGTRGYRDDEVA